MRAHIREVLLRKLDQTAERRREALVEFFGVTMGEADQRATERLAEIVPPLLPQLYEKWIAMFLDRLFETVPMPQLETLCDGTDDNNAALILIYLMFLESERMEKQIDKDLHQYGLAQTGNDSDMGDLASCYIRAKMAQLGREIKGLDKK
ncbi:hypothetical protein GGQ74_000180 [Desulfobaculum xiamenense]|uniref:Uncharacterized protein n=1 Tax=Desulfobaculum xiamenense TaxID=995050 RepID=A0A846QHE9_9BACT|nr:hypothetical protein [Desulfobaculum xiamenense]NJB66540.1 hypothetical protein [Desulfobaculum xiamenense]